MRLHLSDQASLMRPTIAAAVFAFVFPVAASAQPTSQPTSQPTTQPTSQPTTELGEPPTAAAEEPASFVPETSWVQFRVAEATLRLTNSEEGQIVLRALEAHGGLDDWYAAGPLGFRFHYQRGDGSSVDTRQVIDTWSSRARHTLTDDASVHFGWTGSAAWVSDPDAELPINPRFWSLTPYYFVAVPFVLADEGLVLESEGTAELHGRPHDVVRVTFSEGVGDSPDDFYVVYFDQETGMVGGLRYIVTYPGFFPDGGSSPEKLMVYSDYVDVDGIQLATRMQAYAWTEYGQGEPLTETDISEYAFQPELEAGFFDLPTGATEVEGY